MQSQNKEAAPTHSKHSHIQESESNLEKQEQENKREEAKLPELNDYEKWLEQAEHESQLSAAEKQAAQHNEDLEPEPPDLELDRSKQSSTISNASDPMIAENTELEALTKAEQTKKHYQSTDNRTNKNVVVEYQLKLAETTAKFDLQKVIQHFRDATPNALDCERIIRDYLRRKGFNDIQIRKAMLKASPAAYKKSAEAARRYAKKFNNYLQQHERNQQQKLSKEKARNRKRGRTR